MESSFTRRGFVQAVGASGIVLAAGSTLSGCGRHRPPAADLSERTPRRGGNLRVAITGGGTAETYEPGKTAKMVDFLNAFSVFDPLVRDAPDYQTEPGLAINWEPNADATVWDIELREGVTWHDGKPFGPEDVIYTLRSFKDLGNLNTLLATSIRLDEVKAVGKNRVRVPLNAPFALFKEQFVGNSNALIIQDGAKNFDKPIGTGPFKLRSFTPGRGSVLDANRDYWEAGKPYVDQLQIVSIDDETARLNALLAGEVDIISDLSYTTAKTGGNGQYQVVIGATGINRTLYMRVDQPPFNDVRVRTAMKLIANRPAMINAAYLGYGDVGNDIWGVPGLKYYNTQLPQREQDLDQAKSLLKAAGQSDLRCTLATSNVGAGFVEAATVYAQQCKKAGVTVNIQRVLPSAYFDPAQGYLSYPFAAGHWAAGPSMTSIYGINMVSDAPIPETRYQSPQFDQLFKQASAELDEVKAQALWNEVQRLMWEDSGNIVWAATRPASAVAKNVAGFGAGRGTGWLNGFGEFRVRNWGFID